jgi:glycosyltransferase involved in cell wall biosynthesis
MNKNIKVAFLIPYLSNGGAEKAMFNIALYFYNNNISVKIITGSNKSADNLNRLPAGIKLSSLDNEASLDSPSFFKNTKGLIKYVKAQKPDVLICNSDYLNIAAIMARFFVKKKFKIIISQQFHAGEFLKTLPFKNRLFLKCLQFIVARNADVVACSSKGVAANYAGLYGIQYPSSKIKSIYNPIYEEAIPKLALQPVSDVNFGGNNIKLITVGRLLEQKDQATLIQAFALFVKGTPHAHLYIIGIGKELEALEDLSQKLEVKNRVSFLGFKENPFAYIAKCDLFVLSSKYEGFGNVIVEALATGVNVVSTNCPSGPAEILNDGEFGYLCAVGDPQALCKTINTALQHKMPAQPLINRAKDFSIERTAKEYLDTVFETVA